MVDCGLHAVLIKVAALGLDPHKHLGKSIAQMMPHLCRLSTQFGCNVCGEGGEYETLVLDSPLFSRGYITLGPCKVCKAVEKLVLDSPLFFRRYITLGRQGRPCSSCQLP